MRVYDEQPTETNKKTVNISDKSTSLTIAKIYLWFALGLAITGAMCLGWSHLLYALCGGDYEAGANAYYISLVVFILLYIPSCIAVNISSISKHAGLIGFFYILFAVSFGGLLSSFTLYLQTSTIFYAFLVTSAAFILMGVLGWVTKGKIGAPLLFLIAFVFGLSIISIFNLLLFGGSSYYMYYWIISVLTLAIFLIIAGVDTNRVLRMAKGKFMDGNNTMIIYSAYVLYSDFMIIFYYILRLFAMFSSNKN